MKSPENEKVTVQGLITPVPAVVGSEQAGSRPSKSSDRNATPVRSLAEVADRATSHKNPDDIGIHQIFRRSNKVVRSPPGTPQGIVENTLRQPNVECQPSRPAKEAEIVMTPLSNVETPLQTQLSPREELISNSRVDEEQTLLKCRDVLEKMRLAMLKQKNISMEIKRSVSELEELFDVMDNHRRSWKIAEKEQKTRDKMRYLLDKKLQTPSTEQSCTLASNKRMTSSPAQEEFVKKHKADGQEGEWKTVTNRKSERKKTRKMSQNGQPKTSKQALGKTSVGPADPQDQNPEARKNTVKKMPKQRPEAIFIKPAQGYSYADVLKNLKNKVKPEDSDVTVRSIRKTKTGAILLELAQVGKAEMFSRVIMESLKETAEVKDLRPRTTLEMRDLDFTSTKEDVVNAVCKVTETKDLQT